MRKFFYANLYEVRSMMYDLPSNRLQLHEARETHVKLEIKALLISYFLHPTSFS
jgi:hypothetical protein